MNTMHINGTDIDTTLLLEYWRMSRAFYVSRYNRMLWASERYSTLAHERTRAYRALDIILQGNN